MHTVLVILAGLVLLALAWGLARMTGRRFRALLPAYLIAWLICATGNLWIGVARAGHGLAEELSIFAVVFALPALAAAVLARKG